MANTKITSNVISDDIALGGNPTTTTQSAGNNTTRIATTAFVKAAIDATIDSAPGALDTLNELAAAIGDDANFSTTITNSIATKAPLASPTFTGALTIDDITIDGSTISDAGDIAIDAGGDIILDADGADIQLKDGGTHFGNLTQGSNNAFIIKSVTGDSDIFFQGVDGSTAINALQLDMSDSGYAYFNRGIDIKAADGKRLRFTDADGTFRGGIQAVEGGGQMIATTAQHDIAIRSQSNLLFSSGGNTERMRIAGSSGNVGIGIDPATTLHLDASGGAVLRMQRTSANASNKLELSHDGTDGTITSTNDLIVSAGGNTGVVYDQYGAKFTGSRALTTGQNNAQGNVTFHAEKIIGSVGFANGTANLGTFVNLPTVTGDDYVNGLITLEITTTYSNQNGVGVLKKEFAFGGNPNGSIWQGSYGNTTAIGATANNVTIGNIFWDSNAGYYRIPVYHIVSNSNTFIFKLSVFTSGNRASDIVDNATVSSASTNSAPSPFGNRQYTAISDGFVVGADTTAVGGFSSLSGAGNEGFRAQAGYATEMTVSNAIVAEMNRRTSNGVILNFRYNGTSVGTVSTNSNSLPSDKNFKRDIADLNLGLDFVNSLNPKQYRYKIDDEDTPVMYGIIAQDLEKSLKDNGVEENASWLLQKDEEVEEGNSQYSLDYTKLIPTLINSIKELKAENDALKARIETLEG